MPNDQTSLKRHIKEFACLQPNGEATSSETAFSEAFSKSSSWPREPKVEHSGFIIVRLSEHVPLESEDCQTLLDVADELSLPAIDRILKEYNLDISRRVISCVSQEMIIEMERNASRSAVAPLHSLTRYWRIDVRNSANHTEEIVKYLNALDEVDLAYLELSASDPTVHPKDDPYNIHQDYLDAAPVGIDARWAWTQQHGEGAGIGLTDLEQGWFPKHEDFLGKSPQLIYGDNRDGVGTYKGNHGTAVLGQLIADDNQIGVVGIAPSAHPIKMVSHYDAKTRTALHVADALVASISEMNSGDILLLEVQRSYLPTEVDDADFDAIRLAVAHGMVVVEAAGNGGKDLDKYTNSRQENTLNRGNADFRDSGAIMVGASRSAIPHNRIWFSNFGTRIDCYGWGENIVTCGYGDLDPGVGDESTYTDSFGGTSGASPMVAGAAIIVQGMYEANTGTRISPLQMRALLANPMMGTRQGRGARGAIGVMPNLRAIIERGLGVVPDIYLRDNVGDSGIVPYAGKVNASPDLILRKSLVTDGQLSFGEGSGNENNNSLGNEAEAGQDNYIYVRMKNRGGADASKVRATVYWSEVSTLVTPDMWTLIGTTKPLDVPRGDTLHVADPLVWRSSDIPDKGHYCFVGVLDHSNDPAPSLPSPTDWDGFRNMVRNNNNVTWRNFNVVYFDKGDQEEVLELPFTIAGAPDISRKFDVEIIQQVPSATAVILEVPRGHVRHFVQDRNFEVSLKGEWARIWLPTTPSVSVPNICLKVKARIAARFIVKDVGKHLKQGNKIGIRQLFEQQEVGQVTWQFENATS